MNGFTPCKGRTVYGVAGHSEHLIILCSDPVFYPSFGCEAVLSVNVTSWRKGLPSNDGACILDVGDHPFIRHKSFAFYERSTPMRADELVRRVRSGEFIPREDLDPAVLERVIKGFRASTRTPFRILKFLKLLGL